MQRAPKAIFKRKDFRGAFRLHESFREKTPTRAKKVRYSVPSALMVMGTVEFIGYRTTHGRELVLYRHDFAPGSRPQLAAGPKRNQLFMVGGRYRVTDRGIVDLTARGQEIDNPQHGEDLNPRDPFQPREESGQYSHSMEAVCVCGHRLGQHLGEGPVSKRACVAHECDDGPEDECTCTGFRKRRLKSGET